MKKKTLFFLFVSIPYFSYTQTAPEIEWQNTIGGDAYDELYILQQTSDGGYIIGGSSNSGTSGDKFEINIGADDYWIIKLNAEGEIEWQNTIGGNSYDELSDIKQTPDSGYILAGSSISGDFADKTEESIGFSYDYWVVKTDNEGNVEWDNTIGGDEHDWLQTVDITDDGGYILGGYSRSGISDDKSEPNLGLEGRYDYWIIKLHSDGNIIWDNTIGAADDDRLYSIQHTDDGGYILGGKSLSNASADKTEDNMGMAFTTDYWIVKLNEDGELEWDNTIGGNNADNLISVSQTSDEGYIIGGYSASNISGDKTEDALGTYNTYDYWVLKLNYEGEIEWQNTIWGDSMDYIYSIKETIDGGYIIGGYSSSDSSGDKTENSNGDDDYWIVKLDMSGSIEWDKTFGGNTFDFLRSIVQTADGGYILGGSSLSEASGDKSENNAGSSDFWVIKQLSPDCPVFPFYADDDSDGYGNSMLQVTACVSPAGFVSDSTDCNDADASIHPGVYETCNMIDDNCNLFIDEGLLIEIYYPDADEDGYGNAFLYIETCADTIPAGYTTDSTDCDDGNAFIHEPVLYFTDADNDLYGDSLNAFYFCSLLPPFGYVTNNNDCDDSNPYINPFSNEILNGLDDNCNDTIDEGFVFIQDLINSIFLLYPNPNNGAFTIILQGTINDLRIEIFNYIGEEVYAKDFYSASELHLEMPENLEGIFHLFLFADDKIYRHSLDIVK